MKHGRRRPGLDLPKKTSYNGPRNGRYRLKCRIFRLSPRRLGLKTRKGNLGWTPDQRPPGAVKSPLHFLLHLNFSSNRKTQSWHNVQALPAHTQHLSPSVALRPRLRQGRGVFHPPAGHGRAGRQREERQGGAGEEGRHAVGTGAG